MEGLKCKVGDLAIVITGPNAGSLFEVKYFVGVGYGFTDLWSGVAMNSVKSLGGEHKGNRLAAGAKVQCPDHCLRPLRGDSLEETAPPATQELTCQP